MIINTEKGLASLLNSFESGKRGIGGGLVIRKQTGVKSGGIYFKGISRNKLGKQVELHIGTYGKGVDKLNLKEARQQWEDIKRKSIELDQNPCDYKKVKKQDDSSQITFGEAVEAFLSVKHQQIKQTTFSEYRLKLHNQVMPHIGSNTPLKDLEWSNGGRRKVMNAITEISIGGKNDLAHRCQHLMKQVFNYSISEGYMYENCLGGGRNPADKLKGDLSPSPSTKHHPAIDWKDAPGFFREICLNRCNSHIQTVLASKMLLMTFLWTGALSRLEWSWFDSQFPNTITIPGSTLGLKRKKGKNDDIPHHVPNTKEMRVVFNHLRELNGDTKYVFQPMRQSKFPHLDPSAINNYFRGLGYKEKLRAHGWRTTTLTTGIDVLKFDSDVIRKQMGHLPEGKVAQAYDKSLRLEERFEFMNKWCQLLVANGLEV